MAFQAVCADTTNSVQVHPMTKGAGILNISCGVMIGPVLRVGIILTMTALTASATCTVNPDVESRIAAGAAGLAMTFLADCQICFGIRAMIDS